MQSGLGSAEDEGLWDSYPIAFAIHIVIFVLGFASGVWYNQRKHLFPLKGRGTREVFVLWGLFLVASLSVSARSPSWPCVCDLVVSGICSHCGAVVYAYRLVVLLSQHEIASELHFGLQSVEEPRGWFGRRCLPFFRRSGTWFIVFGVCVGLFYFCLALSLGHSFRCRGIAGKILNLTLVMACFPGYCYLTYQMRRAPVDGRQMFMEYRIMLACLLFYGMNASIVMFSGYGTFTVMLLSDSVAATFIVSSLWFPIYLTYKQDKIYRTLEGLALNGPLRFEDLVHIDGFLEAFLLHLKREFNAESLVFWQAVTTFKASVEESRELKERNAQLTFDTFVAAEAPFQINISLESVQKVWRLLEEAMLTGVGISDVFDPVMEEVVDLLQNDPLPRFLHSPAGAQFRV